MRNPERIHKKSKSFPWLLLLALLATTYFFWVLPRQLGHQPIKVEFINNAD